MYPTLDKWFQREILIHEAALVRYLQRAWPNRDEIHDLRQEVYVRVFEAARKSLPHSPKSFLFSTARNLLVDRVRRGRVVAIEAVGDMTALSFPMDEVSEDRRYSAQEDLRRLNTALHTLPSRCREIIWMRRIEDVPQKEVAERLGMTEKAVERQLAKGVRRLAERLFSNDAESKGSTRVGEGIVTSETVYGTKHRD